MKIAAKSRENIRNLLLAWIVSYCIVNFNVVGLFVALILFAWEDMKHPTFDSSIKDKNKVLMPWEKGY